MIAFIGEILVDMFGERKEDETVYRACSGGASLNAGVNAKKAGAEVAFVGCVGNDTMGRFLLEEAKKARFQYTDIQIDRNRNTTLAFVTLTDGERSFSFNRKDTADFNIDFDKIDFEKYQDLNTVYLGSIMLSEAAGRAFADRVIAKVKEKKIRLAFDVNFRVDLYSDLQKAVKAYKPLVESADIVKFSEEEIRLYTGIDDPVEAIKSVCQKDRLYVLTLGSEGSMYCINGRVGTVGTERVTPIDTTGAGDAFFGTLLACLEGKDFLPDTVESALMLANKAGAEATQFIGAIKF